MSKKNIKTALQIILAILSIYVLILGLKALTNSPVGMSLTRAYSEEAARVGSENAVKIQIKKDRAEWARWHAQEQEAMLVAAQYTQKIKDLPRKSEIAFIRSVCLLVALAGSVLAIGVGVAVSIVKISTANSVTLAALGAFRKTSDAEWRTRGEQIKLFKEELRFLGDPRVAQSDMINDQTINIMPQPHVSGAVAIAQGHIAGPKIFLGYDDKQDPVKRSLADIQSLGVAGDSGTGKSTFLAMVLALVRLGGGLLRIIDLHGEHEESLTGRLGDVATLSGVEVCKRIEDVSGFLSDVTDTIDNRLKQKDSSNLAPMVVVISEIIALSDDCPEVVRVKRRIVTEGRKVNMYSVADAQIWTREAVKSTTIRSTLRTFACFRVDADQSRFFLGKKNKAVEDYAAGEYWMKEKGRGSMKVFVPEFKLADMAMLAKRAGDVLEPQPIDELSKYRKIKRPLQRR